jgi:hypothetical protein
LAAHCLWNRCRRVPASARDLRVFF